MGVVVTSDGGANWSFHQPFSPPNPQWDGLNSISCPTTKVCWIAASDQSSTHPSLTQGAMFTTRNGGQTWLPVQLPTGLGNVSQVDALRLNHVWRSVSHPFQMDLSPLRVRSQAKY